MVCYQQEIVEFRHCFQGQWRKFKIMYVGKRLPFCGLAGWKSPTWMSHFLYSNANNVYEEGNFEGDKESFWDNVQSRLGTYKPVTRFEIKDEKSE